MKPRLFTSPPTNFILSAVLALAPMPVLAQGGSRAKPSDTVTAVLRDGTVVRGKIDLKAFEVDTAFGKLTVPASEIVRIRIGKKADRELKASIDKLVADLASKEFRAREEAQKELAKLGKLAYAELEAATFSADPEVAERAAALLADIGMDDEESVQPLDDEIVTSLFMIRGTAKFESLSIATPYGVLKIDKKDLLTVNVAEPDVVVKTVRVTGEYSAQTQWLDTGIRLKKGGQLLVNASGSINWVNAGCVTEPKGNSNYGTWRSIGSRHIYIGALVGKIGVNGTPFLLGDKYNDKAVADGTLFLGVATNWPGTQMQPSGEYKVKIEHRPPVSSP